MRSPTLERIDFLKMEAVTRDECCLWLAGGLGGLRACHSPPGCRN